MKRKVSPTRGNPSSPGICASAVRSAAGRAGFAAMEPLTAVEEIMACLVLGQALSRVAIKKCALNHRAVRVRAFAHTMMHPLRAMQPLALAVSTADTKKLR